MGTQRKNSYDFIRLLAATLVVFSHSFALTGNPEPLLGAGLSLGTLGVLMFFILSGYLIAISWDQYPRFNIFFAKRALRIFPGLVVNIFLTVLVLGIFFSTLSAIDFFSQQSTLNFLSNIFLYDRVHSLPGVFTDNIYASSVNGSLWTLPYEFTLYIAVALIGVFGLYKKIKPIWMWAGLMALAFIIALVGRSEFDFSIFYLRFDRLIMLSLLFFSGIMAYKYAHKITLTYTRGFIALGIFIASAYLLPDFVILSAAVFLAYALFALGRSAKLSSFGKIGDLSYGIYIYSYPIQQIIYATTETQSAWKMFALSFTLSVILSLLSWHLIEKRALRYKGKLNLKRYPLTQSENAW